MANLIQNSGQWGPIEEAANTAGLTQKSWEGREIKFVFDDSTTTGIHYTAPIGLPLTSQTEFVWNNEAVDCADTADMTIYWQGTDDPSVAMAAYGNGSAITASDTTYQYGSLRSIDLGIDGCMISISIGLEITSTCLAPNMEQPLVVRVNIPSNIIERVELLRVVLDAVEYFFCSIVYSFFYKTWFSCS